MKNYIYALGALALVTANTPAIAQTVTSVVPYGQTAALPPAVARRARSRNAANVMSDALVAPASHADEILES